jgi:hypothetical protein
MLGGYWLVDGFWLFGGYWLVDLYWLVGGYWLGLFTIWLVSSGLLVVTGCGWLVGLVGG